MCSSLPSHRQDKQGLVEDPKVQACSTSADSQLMMQVVFSCLVSARVHKRLVHTVDDGSVTVDPGQQTAVPEQSLLVFDCATTEKSSGNPIESFGHTSALRTPQNSRLSKYIRPNQDSQDMLSSLSPARSPHASCHHKLPSPPPLL